MAYDCFGAGQQVAQVTFAGHDWRRAPHLARAMFDTFTVMQALHEMLWYLTGALALPPARPLRGQLRTALDRIERITRLDADALLAVDPIALRDEVGALLRRASELARAGTGRRRIDHRGADLIGADLHGADLTGADLTGADLRGAYLIGADLTGADLRWADLIRADLRWADLGRADLTGLCSSPGPRSPRLAAMPAPGCPQASAPGALAVRCAGAGPPVRRPVLRPMTTSFLARGRVARGAGRTPAADGLRRA